jgi:transposase
MVVELHKTGKSSGEIARDLDIATDLVRRWCRECAATGDGSLEENGTHVFTHEQLEIVHCIKPSRSHRLK